MRASFLILVGVLIAAPVSAQVAYPGQPYVGDPLADRLRDRVETQRLRSAEQAAFAREQRLNARLTALEVQAARLPEPFVPLVDTGRPLSATPRSEDAAARRGRTAAGVTQIDDWLDRQP